jgi:hypothetical protein
MNTEICCNHNCNQGRDCPLRKRNLAEEITEGFKTLEVMRNNKPVAWMLVDENWNDFCRYSSYPTKGATPLYTHPHPDNLGLAESIIKQQELRIAELEAKIDEMAGEIMTLENRIGGMTGYGHN